MSWLQGKASVIVLVDNGENRLSHIIALKAQPCTVHQRFFTKYSLRWSRYVFSSRTPNMLFPLLLLARIRRLCFDEAEDKVLSRQYFFGFHYRNSLHILIYFFGVVTFFRSKMPMLINWGCQAYFAEVLEMHCPLNLPMFRWVPVQIVETQARDDMEGHAGKVWAMILAEHSSGPSSVWFFLIINEMPNLQ